MRLGEPPSAELAQATVLTSSGDSIPIVSFWTEGACLLVLLRHFGCIGCSQNVTELSPRLTELAQLGVRTVFIGNGAPHFMEGFLERHALRDKKVTLVTDPSLGVYRAFRAHRGFWATWGPRALMGGVHAFLNGHQQRAVEGDSHQQGGSMLVDASGVVSYLYRNQHLTDHAPTVTLVDHALRKCAQHSQVKV